jgi:hypothetical protein
MPWKGFGEIAEKLRRTVTMRLGHLHSAAA